MDSEDGGVILQNGSKSSSANDLKGKQSEYPILVELKKAVLENSIETFS